MEEAIFLTRFASEVIVIHRRDQLRASKIMADNAISNKKIKFVWDSVVTDITGDNEVEAVKVKNVKTDKETQIDCNAYFAALGHIPNTKFLDGITKDGKGYVVLQNNNSRTNIDGVFRSRRLRGSHISASCYSCRNGLQSGD